MIRAPREARNRARAARLAALLTLSAGCASPIPRSPSTPTGPPLEEAGIHIVTRADTLPLTVELATTPEARDRGLQRRPHLPPERGMLFVFHERQPAGRGFWMARTPVPLDLAFLDAEGVILSTTTMKPCRWALVFLCALHRSRAPFRYALEVNAGYFDVNGVHPGDRVLIPPDALLAK